MVQLSDELLKALDQRAAHAGRSRSHLIRVAIERYIHQDLEAELDRQIVAGYQRLPQHEDLAAEQQLRDYIAAEPW